jgi:hypothetical protein
MSNILQPFTGYSDTVPYDEVEYFQEGYKTIWNLIYHTSVGKFNCIVSFSGGSRNFKKGRERALQNREPIPRK